MPALHTLGDSLREALLMFWDTLWALVLGFGLSGAVQAFVSRAEMQRTLGRLTPGSTARATFFGMVSSSCSYAASAMARTLFRRGADFRAAMIFMFASTNLVVELGIVLWLLIGWQFTAAEFAGGVLMIGLFALLSLRLLPPRLTEPARADTLAEQGHVHHSADAEAVPLRTRLRSAAGWSDAAGYTLGDITMLRREMVIGYGVAGLLAVAVPTAVWNAVFINGHGVWTAIENAVVGPFIALISFVCSIGNVPLAAALWKGGISFGGVAAFIFADLISLPLVLIYRKFYGWRLTLRLVALFWLVMSLAGLAIDALFSAARAVPQSRPAEIVPSTLTWNYTTVLNIVFLAVFGLLWWLARNRARFGGGADYANDPMCGMQVSRADAPASIEWEGARVYFCSEHCRDRFLARPRSAADPVGAHGHH